jgi:hydroxyacylglutathione hydrolase
MKKKFNKALRTAFDEGEDAFVESILEGQPEPPIYFARMKRVNKEGPDVSGALPVPSRVPARELEDVLGNVNVVILDTRSDRRSFMERHVRGSLYVPLGDKFTTVAGSFVEPELEIMLAVESTDDVDDAVRGLIRIGLDQVIGYVVLDEALNETVTQALLVSTSADIDALRETHPGSVVLDVRSEGEYAEEHVPDSINVAYTRLARNLDKLPAGRKLIVHCGSGLRASFAVPWLERAGFDVIYSDGSFLDWHDSQQRKKEDLTEALV